jgi:hypothetical protein
MPSLLQDWVTKLSLEEQHILLESVRFSDNQGKEWVPKPTVETHWPRNGVQHSLQDRLIGFVRYSILNHPYDANSKIFTMPCPPSPFTPEVLTYLPAKWYIGTMWALDVISIYHPDDATKKLFNDMFLSMAGHIGISKHRN